MKGLMKDLIPIIRWLPLYNWRNDFVTDFIAGLTVSSILIPQAIAYALLADQQPNQGLLVSFYSSILYTLLGTSNIIECGKKKCMLAN